MVLVFKQKPKDAGLPGASTSASAAVAFAPAATAPAVACNKVRRDISWSMLVGDSESLLD